MPEHEANPLLIRRFAEDDTAEVTSLWLRVFPDDPPWNAPGEIIRHKRQIQPDLFWVGVSELQIAATVMAGYDGNRGWIYHLAVAPEQRRKGFGRAMMAHAEARLRSLSCPKVNLQIRSSNISVARFYQGLDYAIEERVSMGKRLD